MHPKRRLQRAELNGRCSHRSAIDNVLSLKNGVEDGRVGEHEEAEAAWPARDLITHDYDLSDVSVVSEVFSEGFLRCFPSYPSYEQLSLVRIHLSLSLLCELNG